jgi:glycosyltransferase involved in cell wall biosynthesis
MSNNFICSVIIPTIGRETLTRAVTSILEQDFDAGEFEIIVVNDSGNPLPDKPWMKAAHVRILETDHLNRSAARNYGAAAARGRYFHFLDDDDYMLPEAFKLLYEKADASQSGWVYGGYQLVNNQGDLIKQIIPLETGNCFIQMIAFEWIPLQSSWIRSDAFFRCGGFASLESLGGGFEDIDLSRLVAYSDNFARVDASTAVIRFGDASSTTNYSNLVRQNRISREKCLNLPGAFNRMRSSARSSANQAAYWHGKIFYYYLTSLKWNLRQKLFIRAIMRGVYLLFALVTSVPFFLFSSFWRGATRPHLNLVRTTLGDLMEQVYLNTEWKQ